jgi:single-stranded DNA-specific DHH superfamily exonuclease
MIPESKIQEIRTYLEKSENPLFFFDDDADGLCSYLLLQKKYDKGHGIAVKTGPVLDTKYLNKVEEYCPDLVVVLDKSSITQEFIENVHVPIVWIDHHPVMNKKGVHYYNSKKYTKGVAEPTTAICYEVTKQDLWIAAAGSLADWYIPKFMNEAVKAYPDLIPKTKEVTDVLFKSEFGKLINKLSFLLKGSTTEVKKRIYSLSKIETPYELLKPETSRGKFLARALEKPEREYKIMLEKAKEVASNDKILLYTYPSTKNSYTAELSNEITYLFPDKLVIIAREKSGEMKMSLRSMNINIPEILENALKDVKGYGGGHEHACGSVVSLDDFNHFLDNIRNQIQ